MDWAAHLEHLQTVLQEFDANAVISEPVLIRLFRNGLRPSIRAQAKQECRPKDTLDQAIKKAIMAEAKAAVNLPSWVREMDVRCPQGHRSASKATENHTKDQGSFPFRPQEAQTIPPHRSERAETSETPRQDHQKGRYNRNRCNRSPHGSRSQGSTLATGVNATETLARNDCGCNKPVHRENRDMSRTTCYNCNKKGHFANQCPEPRKLKN